MIFTDGYSLNLTTLFEMFIQLCVVSTKVNIFDEYRAIVGVVWICGFTILTAILV